MKFIDSLIEKNVHIVGICGAETSAIARYLQRSGCKNLTLHDFNTPKEFKDVFDISHAAYKKDERQRVLDETLAIPALRRHKDDYLNGIEDADVIFVSQNWYNYGFNKPALFAAKERGIPFYTITQLYFSMIPAPIIGVTGTNGKTTTSNLIRHILDFSGKKAYFAGNDRYSKQILEQIDDIKKDDAVVLEISNRQLIPLDASPHIAVITNIARDHIEEHGSFEEYVNVKKKIFSLQKESDFAIINYDDDITRDFANDVRSKVFYYSLDTGFDENGAFLKDGVMYAAINGEKVRLADAADLRIKGMHNVSNALAASLAALIFGVAAKDITAALKDFTGIKNRLELIRELAGVRFYNDISSTSPYATIAAIDSFSDTVILIAGGMDKDMDFTGLCGIIDNKVKSAILLPGSATDKMTAMLGSYENADTLQAAVEKAYAIAKEGDVVVLSPAAANFFTMYVAGKKGFNRIVKRLKRKR
jgi:UDP-N-acetylmuramoylalanine--D-glutamate ligase